MVSFLLIRLLVANIMKDKGSIRRSFWCWKFTDGMAALRKRKLHGLINLKTACPVSLDQCLAELSTALFVNEERGKVVPLINDTNANPLFYCEEKFCMVVVQNQFLTFGSV